MDVDTIWAHVDQQRLEVADLLDDLDAQEWEHPSLCTDWRVRDVAAHLALAHTGAAQALVDVVRSGGRFDVMIRDTARRQARRPVGEHAARLRAMVGSRRRAPLVSPLEPLIDVLVHAQDVVRPLGRTRAVPPDAAAAAAERAWSMGFPFRAQRRLGPVRLVATDHAWTAGEGEEVRAPVGDLLLLVTGRDVVLPDLGGPGADRLRTRLLSR
ncbi:TIGR03083 family protein [Nocardioides scoriae]|uniref:TIGR03083 family protein n=1 Tax=Nocardioides scoriae TaxID=642780 RepID=A0A1H1WNZ3_9ACTN|nr:maleylpyruvate isomerase family mycothiol-dependent enzyme [Nocardioides scoriae]SDS98086.1 TIGR03083 family protein [Nocardioides scoriae]